MNCGYMNYEVGIYSVCGRQSGVDCSWFDVNGGLDMGVLVLVLCFGC
jgi:hypothetical protein